jgi:hypothetical protein
MKRVHSTVRHEDVIARDADEPIPNPYFLGKRRPELGNPIVRDVVRFSRIRRGHHCLRNVRRRSKTRVARLEPKHNLPGCLSAEQSFADLNNFAERDKIQRVRRGNGRMLGRPCH